MIRKKNSFIKSNQINRKKESGFFYAYFSAIQIKSRLNEWKDQESLAFSRINLLPAETSKAETL